MPIGSLGELGAYTLEYAVGFGLGLAVGRGLEPLATTISQDAWHADPSRALDPADASRIAAQGLRDAAWAAGEAALSGINGDRFRLLHETEMRAPTVGELLELIRRSQATDADVEHALRKAQLEDEWHARIRGLAVVPLEPAEVAKAIHRNIISGPDLLTVAAPSTPGRVPQVPVSPIDAKREAAWSGYDAEKLRVLVGTSGLPLSLMEMLSLLNRGAVTADDVKRSVAQSDLRNEYMDVALELRRHLLTPTDYVNARLRGWINDEAMYAGTSLHGVTHEDTDLIFKTHGRPLSFHQVWVGLQRGGTYDGPTDAIDPAFLRQLQQSDIRPEWYNLAWAQRHSLPSAFVVRQLQTRGTLSARDAEAIYVHEGWPPDLARKVADATAAPTTATEDPWVKKAEGTLFTAQHKQFMEGVPVDAQVRETLTLIGIEAPAQARILELWRHERALKSRKLTPTQIHRAFDAHELDEPTALAELKAMGLSEQDARAFLRTPLP